MTTETETAQPKQPPAFYIFTQSQSGKNERVGAAFKHGKGNGYNVLIGKSRYVAFPPKAKTAAAPEATTKEGA